MKEYKYLYNGKELQDELLGGVNLDWYEQTRQVTDALQVPTTNSKA